MKNDNVISRLKEKGLKVTPQRIAILDSILRLNNHPTAENISENIKINHPNISTATIYKVLDTFVETGVIKRVKTDRDVMRYDSYTHNHHHLYCSESDRIEDFNDEVLTSIIAEHIKNKGISGFKVEDIRVQLMGRFIEKK